VVRWEEIADSQDGVIGRTQAIDAGLTRGVVRRHLVSGRWQRLDDGVFVTFTGPVPDRARLWAALVRAGQDAVAGPCSSLWLYRLLDRPPPVWDVVIPERRRVRTADGVPAGVHRRRDLDRARHPALSPPRLRVEVAVLDVAASARAAEPVVDLVVRAVQRRLTTADRLAGTLAERRYHPWRELLTELTTEVRDGVRSPLERRWLRSVERAHRLPPSRMNHPEATSAGTRYRDAVYEPGLICELDGREAHPDEAGFRDRARDNRVTVSGRTTLRYGWREVAGDPCAVAAEVAAVLEHLGRTVRPQPCGPACRLGRT
jgi:hypothetical protein